MKTKNQKPVASVQTTGGLTIGSSSVIRWGDTMEVQGYVIQVSKAVELGLKHDIEIATLLKKDLKSKTGLLITFPIAILMDRLQKRLVELGVGDGATLLELVKPDGKKSL